MGQNSKEIIKHGSTGELVKSWQRFLNALGYFYTDIDGIFDQPLLRMTKKFQSLNGLKPDGIVGPKTLSLRKLQHKLLHLSDFQDAADQLDIDINAVEAVTEVESNGRGFFIDGRPLILFEAHKFSQHTGGKYNGDFPNISSKVWDKSLYNGGIGEYKRLSVAMTLNKPAAYKSASWGRFQILGSNFRYCGFSGIMTFVDAMYQHEREHLKAFVSFVKAHGLDEHLRNYNWTEFARAYNGPRFYENQYHIKLRREFLRNVKDDQLEIEPRGVEEIPAEGFDFGLLNATAYQESFNKYKFDEF